jgi:uncharacterized protein (TIGR02147 family)
MTPTSYRELLKLELADRVAANPSYSLRAMARQLKVSPAMLSAMLSGKRNLSAKRAFDIARALKFSKNKTEYFVTLVQYDSARSNETRADLMEKLITLMPRKQANKLDLDHFKLIADWYHAGVLKMTSTNHTTLSPAAIADYFGISKDEASDAVERLTRLSLLEKDQSGRLSQTNKGLQTASEIPNEALRKFHEQMLNKAVQALTTQTPKEKFIGSETFAFDEASLQKATDIIEECFSKIVYLASSQADKKNVYHLGIQMFRLNKEMA